MARTYKLVDPITLGNQTFTELTFPDCVKARHLMAAEQGAHPEKNPIAFGIFLALSLAGAPRAMAKELDTRDVNAISKLVQAITGDAGLEIKTAADDAAEDDEDADPLA